MNQEAAPTQSGDRPGLSRERIAELRGEFIEKGKYGTGEGLALSFEFMLDAFDKWWKPTGDVPEALKAAFREAFQAGWEAREDFE